MKKLLLIPVLCLLFHLNSVAQDVKVGVTAGASFANYDIKFADEVLKANTKIGFAAGLLADINIGENFSIQPAINFVQKGTKERITENGSMTDESLTVNSVEVPLNILLNLRGSAGNFFIGAGPSLCYSISGTWKESQGSNAFTQKVQFGNGMDNDMTRLDVGANFVAGYCFRNGLTLSFNYNKGFTNLAAEPDEGSIKSHYAGLKVGFLFGGTGKK